MAGVRKLRSGTMQGWFKHYEGHRAFFTLGHRATRREVLNAAHTLEVEHAQIRQGVRPRPDQQGAILARPIGEVITEYLAWGAFQGARRGRPWTPKHQRTRAAQLGWWQEHLHLRVLGDCLGILPSVEPASYPQFLLSSVLGYAEGVKPLYPSYDHPLNTGTAYEQSGR